MRELTENNTWWDHGAEAKPAFILIQTPQKETRCALYQGMSYHQSAKIWS